MTHDAAGTGVFVRQTERGADLPEDRGKWLVETPNGGCRLPSIAGCDYMAGTLSVGSRQRTASLPAFPSPLRREQRVSALFWRPSSRQLTLRLHSSVSTFDLPCHVTVALPPMPAPAAAPASASRSNEEAGGGTSSRAGDGVPIAGDAAGVTVDIDGTDGCTCACCPRRAGRAFPLLVCASTTFVALCLACCLGTASVCALTGTAAPRFRLGHSWCGCFCF